MPGSSSHCSEAARDASSGNGSTCCPRRKILSRLVPSSAGRQSSVTASAAVTGPGVFSLRDWTTFRLFRVFLPFSTNLKFRGLLLGDVVSPCWETEDLCTSSPSSGAVLNDLFRDVWPSHVRLSSQDKGIAKPPHFWPWSRQVVHCGRWRSHLWPLEAQVWQSMAAKANELVLFPSWECEAWDDILNLS